MSCLLFILITSQDGVVNFLCLLQAETAAFIVGSNHAPNKSHALQRDAAFNERDQSVPFKYEKPNECPT